MPGGRYGTGVTGTQDTVLVVVRGPSGAGKSSVATRLRAAYGRGVAVVAQDVLRRTVLRERDIPGGVNIGLIDLVARHALDHGFHTVVEGILSAERNGPMLARLAADHRGRSHLYYLDADFDETVRRHATRPQATEFSPRTWSAGTSPTTSCPEASNTSSRSTAPWRGRSAGSSRTPPSPHPAGHPGPDTEVPVALLAGTSIGGLLGTGTTTAGHPAAGPSGSVALEALKSGTRPRIRAGSPDQETRFSCQALLLKLGFDQATQLLL